MGAWDCGLLDNDRAQDFIGSFVATIEQDIIEIGESCSRKKAGSLSAAAGILLRLSFDFDPIPPLSPPPHFYPCLIAALSANWEILCGLPGNAPELLSEIFHGRGNDLSDRSSTLDSAIESCLFGGQPGVLQGRFSQLEPDLFQHPSARTYMSEKLKWLIEEMTEELADREDVIDLSYTSSGGMIGLLLVLPFDGFSTSRVDRWQTHCEKIWSSPDADKETSDIEFETKFRANVRKGFDCVRKVYGK